MDFYVCKFKRLSIMVWASLVPRADMTLEMKKNMKFTERSDFEFRQLYGSWVRGWVWAIYFKYLINLIHVNLASRTMARVLTDFWRSPRHCSLVVKAPLHERIFLIRISKIAHFCKSLYQPRTQDPYDFWNLKSDIYRVSIGPGKGHGNFAFHWFIVFADQAKIIAKQSPLLYQNLAMSDQIIKSKKKQRCKVS